MRPDGGVNAFTVELKVEDVAGGEEFSGCYFPGALGVVIG